jgi:hypothetical protein
MDAPIIPAYFLANPSYSALAWKNQTTINLKTCRRVSLSSISALRYFGVQLQTKSLDDFEDSIEAWAAFAGERLVKTFAG